jgi:hypothetical protein
MAVTGLGTYSYSTRYLYHELHVLVYGGVVPRGYYGYWSLGIGIYTWII